MRRWEHRSARAETDRRDGNHLFLLAPQKYQNWIQSHSAIFISLDVVDQRHGLGHVFAISRHYFGHSKVLNL